MKSELGRPAFLALGLSGLCFGVLGLLVPLILHSCHQLHAELQHDLAAFRVAESEISSAMSALADGDSRRFRRQIGAYAGLLAPPNLASIGSAPPQRVPPLSRRAEVRPPGILPQHLLRQYSDQSAAARRAQTVFRGILEQRNRQQLPVQSSPGGHSAFNFPRPLVALPPAPVAPPAPNIGITIVHKKKVCQDCAQVAARCPAGARGATGQSGEPGTPGRPGRDGDRGGDSIDVFVGANGAPRQCWECPRGRRGRKGRPGPQGRDGRGGQVGPGGRNGAPARRGRPGLLGNIGPEGARSKRQAEEGVVYVKGKPGPKGFTGRTGPRGDAGESGEEGFRGARGDHGDQGGSGGRPGPSPPGKPGPRGPGAVSTSGDKTLCWLCPPRRSLHPFLGQSYEITVAPRGPTPSLEGRELKERPGPRISETQVPTRRPGGQRKEIPDDGGYGSPDKGPPPPREGDLVIGVQYGPPRRRQPSRYDPRPATPSYLSWEKRVELVDDEARRRPTRPPPTIAYGAGEPPPPPPPPPYAAPPAALPDPEQQPYHVDDDRGYSERGDDGYRRRHS